MSKHDTRTLRPRSLALALSAAFAAVLLGACKQPEQAPPPDPAAGPVAPADTTPPADAGAPPADMPPPADTPPADAPPADPAATAPPPDEGRNKGQTETPPKQ
ncbi:hypothetical protein [Lysobacter enzymogenes]|uniref:Lipoprotein n=1 Tax=Lysobacter enzymogenes TaxID=69 RepID=A0A0S2DDI0_LYSEN|nr:hypothetical protein [Lysobacter enzymogenes]ALN56544.1 lipoprotein [Lysobacter enzymogenes]QQQ00146.1 hypothetical protein JHW41_18875 [Lysobacter enzymogenes]